VVWRQSFWPLDTIALNVTNMTDWLLIILHPHHILGVPPAETHRFQFSVDVACDQWRSQDFGLGGSRIFLFFFYFFLNEKKKSKVNKKLINFFFKKKITNTINK
jgi:hypothetical protein